MPFTTTLMTRPTDRPVDNDDGSVGSAVNGTRIQQVTVSLPRVIILSRARRCARSVVCVRVFLSIPQVLRGQHGLAAARGRADLGLRRPSQRSLCAAPLLHRDEAQSRVLQVGSASDHTAGDNRGEGALVSPDGIGIPYLRQM